MKPEAISCLFSSPDKIEANPHTNCDVSLCVSLQPAHLMASLHSGRQWGTGRGPLESLHSTGFFDFCQPTLQMLSKVTYYLCGCENTLCSSRVCEITWNSIESCSGKAIAVGISYVTKPRPGLNDIIYIRLHSSTPEAICRAPSSPRSISAWPSLVWGQEGWLLSHSLHLSPFHTGKNVPNIEVDKLAGISGCATQTQKVVD